MGIMNLMRAGVRIKETTQITVYILTRPPHVIILPLSQGSENKGRMVALFGERLEGR